MQTEAGNILGRIDNSRLLALPWYKKIWAKLNRKYRNRFIVVKPYNYTASPTFIKDVTVVISHGKYHFREWARHRRIIPYAGILWKTAGGTDYYLPLYTGGNAFQTEKMRGIRFQDIEDIVEIDWLSRRDLNQYWYLLGVAKERIFKP